MARISDAGELYAMDGMPPVSEPDENLKPGIALCLSGGGYRAVLFHLGGLLRLNETGYLSKVDMVAGVSGGSIIAGLLGMKWSRLDFEEDGVASRFHAEVMGPMIWLTGQNLDARAFFGGLFERGSMADKIRDTLDERLFKGSTLQDLPDHPEFAFYATNVQSLEQWRFMKRATGDPRVGYIANPTVPLASAVAASCAFPPVLSPVALTFEPSSFVPGSGEDLQHEPFTRTVMLADGGLYDNLAVQTPWDEYRTILVSDAGLEPEPEPEPKTDILRHSIRVLMIVSARSEMVEKHIILSDLRANLRGGAYWGVRSDIENYGLDDALHCPEERTLELARTPTRLSRVPRENQEKLINWGYAACDAALRKHVDSSIPAPAGFPYEAGV